MEPPPLENQLQQSKQEQHHRAQLLLPESVTAERRLMAAAVNSKEDTDNRLKIKLKISSPSGCSRSSSEEDESNRACKLCTKVFSSGRALGGHMRVHYPPMELTEETHKLINNIHPRKPIVTNKKDYCFFPKNLSFLEKKRCSQPNLTDNAIITRDRDSSDDQPDVNKNNNNIDTTCSVCGRSFPSKKALYGHMRCHPERDWRGIQPPTFRSSSAKIINSSSSTVSDSLLVPKVDPDDGDHDRSTDSATTTTTTTTTTTATTTTTTTEPDFPSWSVKAKRGWTGAWSKYYREDEPIPEVAYDLLMLANGGNSLVTNLSNKRRSEESEGTTKSFQFYNNKTTTTHHHHHNNNDSNQFLEEVVSDGYWRNSGRPSKKNRRSQDEESPEPQNREFVSKKLKIGRDDVSEQSTAAAAAANRSRTDDINRGSVTKMDYYAKEEDEEDEEREGGGGGEEDSEENSEDQKDPYHNSVKNQLSGEMRKKKKKIKLKDLERVQEQAAAMEYKQSSQALIPSAERFKCTTCNKCFPSHQALGGHRSSHNKGKQHMEELALLVEAASAKKDEQFEIHDHSGVVAKLENNNNTHRCQICSKAFPTGQALGGHKRCHWTGPAEAPISSSVAALHKGEGEEAAEEEKGKTARPLMIDLNELPEIEDEVEAEEAQTVHHYHSGDFTGNCTETVDYASSSYNSAN